MPPCARRGRIHKPFFSRPEAGSDRQETDERVRSLRCAETGPFSAGQNRPEAPRKKTVYIFGKACYTIQADFGRRLVAHAPTERISVQKETIQSQLTTPSGRAGTGCRDRTSAAGQGERNRPRTLRAPPFFRWASYRAPPHHCDCGVFRIIRPANALLFLAIHKVCLRKSAFLRAQIFSKSALAE